MYYLNYQICGQRVLLIFPKNQLFVSLISSSDFLFSILLTSAIIIIYFLLLVLKLFCPSFSSSLGRKLRLFLDVSSFLNKCMQCYKFPSVSQLLVSFVFVFFQFKIFLNFVLRGLLPQCDIQIFAAQSQSTLEFSKQIPVIFKEFKFKF